MDHGSADVLQVLSEVSTNLAQMLLLLLGLFGRMMSRHAEESGRDAAVFQRLAEIQQTLQEMRERLVRMEQQSIQHAPQPPAAEEPPEQEERPEEEDPEEESASRVSDAQTELPVPSPDALEESARWLAARELEQRRQQDRSRSRSPRN